MGSTRQHLLAGRRDAGGDLAWIGRFVHVGAPGYGVSVNEEIAVADVSRLREQRRPAITDADRTALRARPLQVARVVGEAVAIQRQLFAAHEALLSAPTLPHRLRAVVRADELRESAERYL